MANQALLKKILINLKIAIEIIQNEITKIEFKICKKEQ